MYRCIHVRQACPARPSSPCSTRSAAARSAARCPSSSSSSSSPPRPVSARSSPSTASSSTSGSAGRRPSPTPARRSPRNCSASRPSKTGLSRKNSVSGPTSREHDRGVSLETATVPAVGLPETGLRDGPLTETLEAGRISVGGDQRISAERLDACAAGLLGRSSTRASVPPSSAGSAGTGHPVERSPPGSAGRATGCGAWPRPPSPTRSRRSSALRPRRRNPSALRLAAGLGGDTDTVAAICGAMLGAAHGVGAFRPDVVETVLAVNRLEFGPLVDELLKLRRR